MERQSLLWCVLAAVAYLVTVRLLRYRRVDAIRRKHDMLERSSFGKLTADQAQDILKDLVEMEFPKLMGFSIVFALFKTYGIPSIASLLVSTGELAGMETASKRTADTGVLILEFALNKPSSQRAIEAIARMNYLHSRYIKSGKISNDNMLYTLSVFALEPLRWVNKYEWRHLSELELCASGTYWKAMGDKMEIDFSPLPSHPDGWTDGLHWLEEVQKWSERYEEEEMVPAEVNHRLATAHLNVILVDLPKPVQAAGKVVVSAVVPERLRKAMMLEEPPPWCLATLDNLMFLRKMVMRHLILPRPEVMRKKYISSEPEKDGRFSSREWLSHPWYVRPTVKRRWGPKAWMIWLLGRKVPGDGGKKYHPEGYIIQEVGPDRLTKSGTKEMEADLDRIRGAGPGGCPFMIASK